MGATDPIPIGCTAIKPVERHGLEAIKWFLYDKETVITSAALKPVFSRPHNVDIFLIGDKSTMVAIRGSGIIPSNIDTQLR